MSQPPCGELHNGIDQPEMTILAPVDDINAFIFGIQESKEFKILRFHLQAASSGLMGFLEKNGPGR